MDDSDFDRAPNPFSAFAESRVQSKRHLAASAKFLIVAVGLFCVVTAGQIFLQRARLAEIINDFSQGSTAEKIEHLEQLQALGVAGIPGLVSAVADEQTEVSETAANKLSDLHRQWTTMPTVELNRRRRVFANALADISAKIENKSDGRWDRVQILARGAARDLIDSACPESDETYQKLMQVVSVAPPRVSSESVVDRSLPIDRVAGASWTDWPPTSTTPTLYARPIATLEPLNQVAVALNQASNGQPRQSDARLLKPRIRPAATLADQSIQEHSGSPASTDHWIAQLESGSRLVRMKAVVELEHRSDANAEFALRSHLEYEQDDMIKTRIRQYFYFNR